MRGGRAGSQCGAAYSVATQHQCEPAAASKYAVSLQSAERVRHSVIIIILGLGFSTLISLSDLMMQQ